MTFRTAEFKDITVIKDHLFLAMEDLAYYMIGQKDQALGKRLFQDMLMLPKSQYSYTNCYVLEIGNQVVASINIYDGAQLEELRKPVLHYLKQEYQREIQPEDETQAGEMYIDTFGVDPFMQGKGLGSTILQQVIQLIVHEQGKTLGLLVDDDNPKAKRLYERLGFTVVGRKTLMGHQLDHMQIQP